MVSASSSTGPVVPPVSGSALNTLDKIDLNNLSPKELEELSQMWQARKASSNNDRLNGNDLSSTWIIDTGASHHMSGCLKFFTNLRNIAPLSVGLPNGDLTIATQSGDVYLSSRLILSNVLYAPNLNCNLISVSNLLIDTTLTIQFSHNFCLIQDRSSKTVIGAGEQVEGLYYLKGVRTTEAHVHTVKGLDSVELWHRRLGHPSTSISRFLPCLSSTNKSFHSKHCKICLRAKQTREPFSLSSNIADDIFDMIHCDLWGPYSANASCGSQYFLTLVDDFSRSTWVYLLRHKTVVIENHEPSTFSQAMQVQQWRGAMKDEIEALERNNTWTLENLPPNKKAIGSKWIYKIKYNSDGTIERYKASLVVMGNRQIEGIDYNQTFAPTIKMVTVRTLLAVAAAKNWALHQMDVHNAFLHDNLDEEVYMKPPPSFVGNIGFL
ncbi:uncharacterized protein LOC141586820 [Silene latifolia]|uniref:uncharacterized protein LOC141586820 n=1 Tax=Silene latifolia TaxID=37657 RepID=UPI003D78AA25